MNYLKVMLTAIILAASFLALTACQEPASPLEDYSWELISYGKPGSVSEVLPDAKVTAFFDSQTKTVSGSGGCNHYSGPYTSDKAKLDITGPMAVTEMWCGDDAGQQETAYLELLQTADRFELEHGNLFIYSGASMLHFKRSDAPPPNIQQWGE